MQILKGQIKSIKEGGKRAQVKTLQNEILDDVLLLHPYGDTSYIEPDETSLVLLFYNMGSKTNIFGIPYNVPLQPELEATEKAVGNFKKGNKITFKANGDIEISLDGTVNVNNDIDTTGDINVDGVYKVNDTQVVSDRGAAVPDASGGGVIDVQARAAINTLLARLRVHGLISP